MRNITIAIDDQTYSKIRVWCALRSVSVSRVVRIFLNDLPQLEQVRRFPLPEAPDERSLAAMFERLSEAEEGSDLIERLMLGKSCAKTRL